MSPLPAPWLLSLALLVPLGQGSPRGLSVSGHLRAVSGEQVCGAVIAAVPAEPGADEESALGWADCQGRYTLGPLEPGVYALTAALPRRGAAVVPGLTLDGHRTDDDLLDLRTLPPVGPVAEWFAAPREVRNVESTHFERFAGAFWRAPVLPRRTTCFSSYGTPLPSHRPRRD